MQKNTTHFHRVFLTKIDTHLRKHYPGSFTETVQAEGPEALHHLDSLLAFKSDSYLEQLRAGLDRIDGGVFGVCLNCKNEIDVRLLEEDPTCRICEQCELTFSSRVSQYEGSSVCV